MNFSKAPKIVVVSANIMIVVVGTEFEESCVLLYFTIGVSKFYHCWLPLLKKKINVELSVFEQKNNMSSIMNI